MIDRVAGETGLRHPGCQNLEVILLWLHSPFPEPVSALRALPHCVLKRVCVVGHCHCPLQMRSDTLKSQK